MELKDILAKCDHTLLAQTATWEEIKAICDDGMKYATASVCIPASPRSLTENTGSSSYFRKEIIPFIVQDRLQALLP